MSKSIADVGWRMFLTRLQQKATEQDTIFLTVNPAYTTQDCSRCGYRKMPSSKGGKQTLSGDRINHKHELHECFECGLIIDRDVNAAKNILTKGLTQLASS